MVRYLTEARNILAEPLGSAEPRLKNTGLVVKADESYPRNRGFDPRYRIMDGCKQ
jgi:hypothetical protein